MSKLWGALFLAAVLVPGSAGATTAKQIFLTKQKQAERAAHTSWLEDATLRKKLQYFGGPVIANMKAYSVLWGDGVNADVQSRIGGMLSATLGSDYMDVLSQYSTNLPSVLGQPGTNQKIGRGSFGGQSTIRPGNASTDLDDRDLGPELEAQIRAGALPKPDADTVYFLYLPPGISVSVDGSKSCEVFCGYHHSASSSFGTLYYAVQPDLGGQCAVGCGFGNTQFESETIVTAHELAEVVTDPGVQTNGELGPPIAWVTSQGEEIGDLCASEVTSVQSANGTVYPLQRAFDNSIGRCNAGPFRQR